MRIIIKDTINTDFAVSTDNGNEIFKLLNDNLSKGNTVLLDFGGITLMTTAFLNAAIGQLYSTSQFNSDFLNDKLKIENVNDYDRPLFALVIQRAKEYFANKRAFESNSENTIYGKD